MPISSKLTSALLSFFLSLIPTAQLVADANIVFQNDDGFGEGFNDLTPTSPVGGNTGTTLGEQRRIAFEYALSILEATLASEVDIEIAAEIGTRVCSDLTGEVIACAGPTSLHWGFTGAPREDLLYPQALANKFAGFDLCTESSCAGFPTTNSPTEDISAEFISSLSVNGFTINWYYGLDKNASELELDFVTVVLHELIHGLGFISATDEPGNSTLPIFAPENTLGDVYSSHLELINGNPSNFLAMTDSQRFQAATSETVNTIPLRWSGERGQTLADQYTSGIIDSLGVSSPPIECPPNFTPGSSLSHVNIALTPDDLMEPNYTEPNHSLGYAAAFLSDIGWVNFTDLSIHIIPRFEPMPTAINAEYWLLASNNGSQPAPNTIVEYTLPANTTVVSANPEQGSCSVLNASVRCELGTLAAFGNVLVTLEMAHSSSASIINQASISGDIMEAEPSNNTTTQSTTFSNSSPQLTAQAGPDQILSTQQGGRIDASLSSADSGIIGYQWRVLEGELSLLSPNSAISQFSSGAISQNVVLLLTITDQNNMTAHDVLTLLVNSKPSIAISSNLSTASSVNNLTLASLPRQIVTLDASESSDTEGISLYQWQQTSGTAISFAINNSTTPTTSFTAPEEEGSLAISASVTDSLGESASTSIVINVSSTPPSTNPSINNTSENTVPVGNGSGSGGNLSSLFLAFFSLLIMLRRLKTTS